ncbi:4938_t:CDS:2, partial [Gigaspora rosea]
NQKDQMKQHWVLFLDQEKAFDRQSAYISESGVLSEPFKINRGGIQINEDCFKVAAYADDMTVGLGSRVDWDRFRALTRSYEEASNARINCKKYVIVPLTNNARRTELEGENAFKKLEEGENITVLGYTLSLTGQLYKDTWPQLIGKVKRIAESMSSRNLSYRGKILLAKSLLLSRIWYTAYILPPSYKQSKELNELMSNWIKNKSKTLPRMSVYQQEYDLGGLKAPIIEHMIDARLTSIWIKLLTSDNMWSRVEREIISSKLRNTRNISLKTALNAVPFRLRGWPDHWK